MVDDMKELIETRHQMLVDKADDFRNEMLALLEEHKTNQILSAIDRMNARLRAIEDRLPPTDDPVAPVKED